MGLKLKVLNRLLLEKVIAAQVNSSSPDRKAWVGVYPFRYDKPGEPPANIKELPVKYRIIRFEIAERILVGDFDIGEDELLDKQDIIVTTIEELESVLADWVGDLTSVDAPWYSDYPL